MGAGHAQEVGSLPWGGAKTDDFVAAAAVCRQAAVYLGWAPREAARANSSREAPQVSHPGAQLVHHAGRPRPPQRLQKLFLENHERGTISAPGLSQGHCRTIMSKQIPRAAGPGTSNGLFHGCFRSMKVEGKRRCPALHLAGCFCLVWSKGTAVGRTRNSTSILRPTCTGARSRSRSLVLATWLGDFPCARGRPPSFTCLVVPAGERSAKKLGLWLLIRFSTARACCEHVV